MENEAELSSTFELIKSQTFDKKMNGVKKLVDILNISSYNEEKKIILEIQSSGIIREIFSHNTHTQIISKSNDILKYLIRYEALSNDDLIQIWKIAKEGNPESRLTIINLLSSLYSELNKEQVKLLIEEIIKSNDSITMEELELLSKFSKRIGSKENCENLLNYLLNLEMNCYNNEKFDKIFYIIQEISSKIDYLNDIIIEACINEIQKSNGYCAFKILEKLIDIRSNAVMIDFLIKKDDLLSIFIENFKRYKSNKTLSPGGCSHEDNIRIRLDFLSRMVYLFPDFLFVEPLYEILIVDPISPKDQEDFFMFLRKMLFYEYNGYDEKKKNEIKEEIFNLFVNKIDILLPNLDSTGFELFKICFQYVNFNHEYLTKVFEDNEEKIILTSSPDDLIGFETLWKIIFATQNELIFDKGIALLSMLFSQTNQINKLVQECINNFESNDAAKIKKSLRLLDIICKESEKNSTGGVRSHYSLVLGTPIEISISVRIQKKKNFFLILFDNITMYELKRIISEKIKIPEKHLTFSLHSVNSIENYQTLKELNIKNGQDIFVYLPQSKICEQLVEYGVLNPKFSKIVNNWFDSFSEEDKMTKENALNFFSHVVNSRDSCFPQENTRITELFEEYDTENKGYLTREDFIRFYTKQAENSPRAVWKNLENVNIRYDLREENDPIENISIDKESLPRYQLGNNKEIINKLIEFYENKEITDDAYRMLFSFSTNISIFNEVLKEGKFIESENLLDNLYKIQIALNFFQTIKYQKDDSYFNDYSEVEVSCYLPFDDIHNYNLKENWILKFISDGLLEKLVKLLIEIFNKNLENEVSFAILEKILFILNSLLVNILPSLNITLQQVEEEENDDFHFRKKVQDTLKISENDFKSENLKALIKKENLEEKIKKIILDENLREILIKHISSCLPTFFTKNKNLNFMSFYFVLAIYADIKIQPEPSFKDLVKDCLTFSEKKNQKFFINSFSLSVREAIEKENNNFFFFLFSCCTSIVDEIEKKKINNIFFFFEFFASLYEVRFFDLYSKSDLACDFALKLFKLIYNQINSQGLSISDDILIGLIKLLTQAVKNSEKIQNIILSYQENQNIFDLVIQDIFGSQKHDQINQGNKFISLEAILSSQKRKNSKLQNALCDLIVELLKNSEKVVDFLLHVDVDVDEDDEEQTSISYYQDNQKKQEGHVGIKNLGNICYMNSIMQQFYMVPTFRYAVLQSEDNEEPKTDNVRNIDDNLLHQLQKMYTFLTLSEREYYDPEEFCFSFKDPYGNPTSTFTQQDSQEFLTSFCEKVEKAQEKTEFKYIISDVFQGKTCSRIICECGNVSDRFEDFCNLSLEVSDAFSLVESLHKYITPESIEGFKCEKCEKIVKIQKRTLISTLPNVLIIHLKRFYMNYDSGHTQKINSRFTFENTLNMKEFCAEMHGNESEEIYYKEDEYYEYILKGVNVHMGFADSGHYFSFINVDRDGKEDRVNEGGGWLKFNDRTVSQFDESNIAEECFGGGTRRYTGFDYEDTQSAYLLVYERKRKTPIREIIQLKDSIENCSLQNIISFKNEDFGKVQNFFDFSKKQKDITVKPDFLQSELKEYSLSNILDYNFYNLDKKEMYRYIHFYNIEKKIPTCYFIQVENDNNQLIKEATHTENTSSFIENLSKEFHSYLSTNSNLESKFSKEGLLKICHLVVLLMYRKVKKLEHFEFNENSELANTNLIIDIEFIQGYLNEFLDYFVQSLLKEKLILSVFTMDEKYIDFVDRFEKIIDYIFYNCPSQRIIILKVVFHLFKTKIRLLRYPAYNLLDTIFNNFTPDMVEFLLQERFISCLLTSASIKIGKSMIDEKTILVEKAYQLFKYSVEFNEEPHIDKKEKIFIDHQQFSIKSELDVFKRNGIMKLLSLFNENFMRDILLIFCKRDIDFVETIIFELLQSKCSATLVDILIEMIDSLCKDKFEKYTKFIGFPVMRVEYNEDYDSHFPLFGYHLMKDKSTNYLKYVTKDHAYDDYCLLSVLENLKDKDMLHLKILQKCCDNYPLFKYLYLMPHLNLEYRSWFDYAMAKVKEYSTKYPEQKEEILAEISDIEKNTSSSIERIKKERAYNKSSKNEEDDSDDDDNYIQDSKDDLSWFNGFLNDYIPKDIVREEITSFCRGEKLHLIRFEYFCTVIPLKEDGNNEIDFSKSLVNNPLSEEEKNESELAQINDCEEKEDTEDNDEIRIKKILRTSKERYFIKSISGELDDNRKIIIFDPELEKTETDVKRVFIRHSLWNSRTKNCRILFKISSNFPSFINLNKQDNFFIPLETQESFPPLNFKDVLLIHVFEHLGNFVENKDFGVAADVAFSPDNDFMSDPRRMNFYQKY